MGHRIQKEFSSDRFKTMSRKMVAMNRDLGLYRGETDTVNADNLAIRKVQKQTGQAVTELSCDVDNINADIINLQHINSYQWRAIIRLRKQNNDLQKWLEGYIILLFAIVVCFGILVFVC